VLLVAVVLAFRIAIMLTPTVARYCMTGGSPPTQGFSLWVQEHLDTLFDSEKSAAEVTAELQATLDEGSVVLVADIEEPFELRKLQVRWSRAPSGGTLEDVDVCTFHFLKLDSGVPSNSWLTADYTTLETAFGTAWGAIKDYYNAFVHLDQYRWYADGPAFYHQVGGSGPFVPIGDNAARRVTEVDVAGTAANGNPMLPPQVAISVTEKVSSRKHWGRFYLPTIWAQACTDPGRLANSAITHLLPPWVTFYNAARAAQLIPVVFSIQKPERPKKPSGTLPAVGAVAYEVTSLQMDDLFDVIRSRRYSAPTIRTNTALT
jgi:hypothetical protein